jgi:hypothetical protein
VPKLSERVQAVVFVAVVVAAIAGLYAAAQNFQPAAVPSAIVHHPRLDVQGVGWSIRYAPIETPNNTAFGILQEAAARLGFSLAYVPYEIPKGMFVTAINGSVNGEGGRYWQYWVGGAYGTVAADHEILRDGDVVLWTFSPSLEGGG